MKKKCNVGGQAVIEGVMMRGEKGVATAVRTPNGKIEISMEDKTPLSKKNKFFSLPIIRGFISLIDSMIIGIQTLNYSASFFEEDGEPDAFEKFFKKIFKDKSDDILIGITLFISFGISILLFFAAPTFIAQGFKYLGFNNFSLNILEGGLRVGIFLIYIYIVGKMDEIKRVFQYHGAEHKTIFCYENGVDLTVDNVKKFPRLHPRCGTNFIFLVMVISILLFSFVSWKSFLYRFGYRLLLLPLVSGITYEIIKWLGKNNNRLTALVAYPGLKLQELTTKEPDDSQIEVAIASLKAAEGIKPKENTIGELLNYSNEELKSVDIDTYVLDSQLLLSKVIEKDKLYLITNRSELVSLENEEEFKALVKKRKGKMPIKYILNHCEFMGLDFYIKEGVLIPRGDTEILVEEALKIIDNNNFKNICDLCTGSGAIGLSIGALRQDVNITCVDIDNIPCEVTNINIERLNLKNKARFIESDLLKVLIENEEKFNMIISNPPYIKKDVINTLMEDVKDFEPHLALDGGIDGLDFYKRIVSESKECLLDEGYLAFEIGHDQGEEVKHIMTLAGYEDIIIVKDLAGLDRVVIGKYISV
ncbi:peptide chain release factor N(5)-glutamine methyltransferase [Clostridium hydrogeniformans]|uniref:peptide chain release factor N(5)-glutamine methyltransferase n=1 Tax=Clostridium hydrogeniformans TaxID=349933 RepID=UPI000559144F|nr:peptide chain release factor N(5)-glutamine methyltransferase [Clostridium hydrogeniformans]